MNKKKRMLGITVIAVVLLVLIVVFCLLFVGKGNNNIFLKLEDYTVQKSHFTYFSAQSYDEAIKILNVNGKALWDTEIEGKQSEKWMKEHAEALSKRYLSINKMFDDAGLTLDDTELNQIKETVYDEWNYKGRLAIYGPMGVEEEAYKDITTTKIKLQKLVDYQKQELNQQVNDDAIKSYLSKNYASFLFVTESYFDAEGNSTLEEYEAYCKQVRDGKSLEALAKELVEANIDRIKTSIHTETGRIDTATPRTGSSFPLAFVTDLFEAGHGEILYFNDTANMTYNIAMRTDILNDHFYIEKYREEITNALLMENMEEKIRVENETITFNVNTSKIKRLDIKEFYE